MDGRSGLCDVCAGTVCEDAFRDEVPVFEKSWTRHSKKKRNLFGLGVERATLLARPLEKGGEKRKRGSSGLQSRWSSGDTVTEDDSGNVKICEEDECMGFGMLTVGSRLGESKRGVVRVWEGSNGR